MSGPPYRPQSDQLSGCVLSEKYLLGRVLGCGAMSTVYQATDDQHREIAIKVVRPDLMESEELLERFFREANITSILDSQHVVPSLACGEDRQLEVLYIVMPYLKGHDVAELLTRLGPVEPSLAAKSVYQAAVGIAAAHREGIIHRDVKPSNLFCHLEDDSVTIRVCDFGIAKRLDMYDDSHLTRSGSSMGSPLYMSPEQILSSKHVDERTDIWGLSATLYELLAGISPFGDATSLADLMVRITSSNPSPLQQLAPWVPQQLVEIVHHALSRSPENRHQSATAFADDLRAVLGNDTAIASRELVPLSDATRSIHTPKVDISKWLIPQGPAPQGPQFIPSVGDPLVYRTIDRKYRIQRLLGRGGMGSVYEATGPGQRRVALKVVQADQQSFGSETLARFTREAQATVGIDSPHVVATIDAGTDADTRIAYIAMELLKGGDLRALFKRVGPLKPETIVKIVTQAALGIDAAHSLRLVHRDIKPANLFLSVTPGHAAVTVKVCDFGVAKRIHSEFDATTDTRDLTHTGGVLGSPIYMSPEQAQSARTVDARSDVWSLGVVLYEGLVGRTPWSGRDSVGQVIVAICTEPVPFLQEYAPWVEPDLALVVHRMLARHPEDRFANMQAVIQALAPHAGSKLQLDREDLKGVDLEIRSRVAARLTIHRSELAKSTNSPVTQDMVREPPAPRASRLPRVAAGALLGLAAVGLGFVLLRKADQQPLDSSLIPDDSIKEGRIQLPPPHPLVGRLRVPNDLNTLQVNGKPSTAKNGIVELKGMPGDIFSITAGRGTTTATTRVALGVDGVPSPQSILLDTAASTAESLAPNYPASHQKSPKPPSSKASGQVGSGVAPLTAPPTTPAPAKSGLDYVKEW